MSLLNGKNNTVGMVDNQRKPKELTESGVSRGAQGSEHSSNICSRCQSELKKFTSGASGAGGGDHGVDFL